MNIIHKIRIRYRWLVLLIFVATLVIMLVTIIFRQSVPDLCHDNERYMLSAISQGLAALFALIFTISLIVLQVSFRFKGVLSEFFQDRLNIIYPLISGVGIVLPLIILRIAYFPILTDIALLVAIFNVFLVLPFFLRMKDFLKYNVGIREDVKYAKELLNQTDIGLYKSFLWEILGLSQEAINQKNYIVVIIALRELLNLSKYVYSKFKAKGIMLVDETLKQFCVILRLANRVGIVKRFYFLIIDISEITDHIPYLHKDTYISISETLCDLAMKTKNVELKKIICRSVWVFSAKWLARNSKEQNTVKNKIMLLASNVGLQFALECNDPYGPHEIYENAAWELHEDNDDRRMLEVMRSWIKPTTSNETT